MLGQRIGVKVNWARADFWKGTRYTVSRTGSGASFAELVDLEVKPLSLWFPGFQKRVPEDSVVTDT
jgi:hypothetical protein